jgi:uncharacterized protein YndB with AHSA1/START domain
MNQADPNLAEEFVIARELAAPRELVWRAWTEPGRMAQWWGPRIMSTPVCEMEVRPGGAYRIVMRGPDGTEYPIRGTFLEVAPPVRLVLTMDCSEHPPAWHQLVKPGSKPGENPAGILLTTVTFEEIGGRTALTIQTRFDSSAIADAMAKMGMTEGWSGSLERLAELLDRA